MQWKGLNEVDGFEVWSKGLGPTDTLNLRLALYGEKNSEASLFDPRGYCLSVSVRMSPH